MKCPNCKSMHVRKFSIIYAEGTAIGTGTSKTILASRCSPPKSSDGSCLFIIISSLFLLFIINRYLFDYIVIMQKNIGNYIKLPQVLINISIFILILFIILLSNAKLYDVIFGRKQRKNYMSELDKWNKKWLCLKCGNEFIC